MSLIEWDSSLSVNVKEIDRQHQKLIGLINQLHDAMQEGKGREVIGVIVTELVDYTETHFKAEEEYFRIYGYPDSESHMKEHVYFVDKVSNVKAKIESGRTTVSVEVMVFLSNWLKKHIKGTDKNYTSFFNENGLI
jgi:hemerythrin